MKKYIVVYTPKHTFRSGETDDFNTYIKNYKAEHPHLEEVERITVYFPRFHRGVVFYNPCQDMKHAIVHIALTPEEVKGILDINEEMAKLSEKWKKRRAGITS